MSAFRAAMQLVTPVTDSAWETLKLRLLDQRDEMEKNKPKEPLPKATSSRPQAQPPTKTETQPKLQSLPQPRPRPRPNPHAKPQEKPQSETQSSEQSKAVMEDAAANHEERKVAVEGPQRKLRLRLLHYADNAIGYWERHNRLTAQNAGDFAVDVLVNVRKDFIAAVEREAAKAQREGRWSAFESYDSPSPRKLTLENLKYVFDTRIQYLTDPLRKDIFRCSGCGKEQQFYQLQGVLQHYAAKHSRSMTVDGVSINWHAEWPPLHPFQVKSTFARRGSASSGPSWNTPTPPAASRPMPPPPRRAAAPPTRQTPRARDPHIGTSVENAVTLSHSTVTPQMDAMYASKRAVVAKTARELWNAVSASVGLTPYVKAFTILFHLNKFFHVTFGRRLPIGLFIDGLLNEEAMRPVRRMDGLFCNQCEQQGDDDRELLTLGVLAQHFLLVHVNYVDMGADHDDGKMDWVARMIRFPTIPDMKAIVGLDGLDQPLLQEAAGDLLNEHFRRILQQNPPAQPEGGVSPSQNADAPGRSSTPAADDGRRPAGGTAATADARWDSPSVHGLCKREASGRLRSERCKRSERSLRSVRSLRSLRSERCGLYAMCRLPCGIMKRGPTCLARGICAHQAHLAHHG